MLAGLYPPSGLVTPDSATPFDVPVAIMLPSMVSERSDGVRVPEKADSGRSNVGNQLLGPTNFFIDGACGCARSEGYMLKPTDSVPAASVTHRTHQVFVRARVLFCSASFVSRSNGPTIFPVGAVGAFLWIHGASIRHPVFSASGFLTWPS